MAAFGVAAFSPLLIAKLLPVTEAAVVAAGVGSAPLRAGQQALSVASYTRIARGSNLSSGKAVGASGLGGVEAASGAGSGASGAGAVAGGAAAAAAVGVKAGAGAAAAGSRSATGLATGVADRPSEPPRSNGMRPRPPHAPGGHDAG
jgi:hypothetical protein